MCLCFLSTEKGPKGRIGYKALRQGVFFRSLEGSLATCNSAPLCCYHLGVCPGHVPFAPPPDYQNWSCQLTALHVDIQKRFKRGGRTSSPRRRPIRGGRSVGSRTTSTAATGETTQNIRGEGSRGGACARIGAFVGGS